MSATMAALLGKLLLQSMMGGGGRILDADSGFDDDDDSGGWYDDDDSGAFGDRRRERVEDRKRRKIANLQGDILRLQSKRGMAAPAASLIGAGAPPGLAFNPGLDRAALQPAGRAALIGDPTQLALVPTQSIAAGGSVSVTVNPPGEFYAAQLVVTGAGLSITDFRVGGVPFIQGAASYGADIHGAASQNNPPLRRRILTSQPITFSITNPTAAAVIASAFLTGFFTRSENPNY